MNPFEKYKNQNTEPKDNRKPRLLQNKTTIELKQITHITEKTFEFENDKGGKNKVTRYFYWNNPEKVNKNYQKGRITLLTFKEICENHKWTLIIYPNGDTMIIINIPQ